MHNIYPCLTILHFRGVVAARLVGDQSSHVRGYSDYDSESQGTRPFTLQLGQMANNIHLKKSDFYLS